MVSASALALDWLSSGQATQLWAESRRLDESKPRRRAGGYERACLIHIPYSSGNSLDYSCGKRSRDLVVCLVVLMPRACVRSRRAAPSSRVFYCRACCRAPHPPGPDRDSRGLRAGRIGQPLGAALCIGRFALGDRTIICARFYTKRARCCYALGPLAALPAHPGAPPGVAARERAPRAHAPCLIRGSVRCVYSERAVTVPYR